MHFICLRHIFSWLSIYFLYEQAISHYVKQICPSLNGNINILDHLMHKYTQVFYENSISRWLFDANVNMDHISTPCYLGPSLILKHYYDHATIQSLNLPFSKRIPKFLHHNDRFRSISAHMRISKEGIKRLEWLTNDKNKSFRPKENFGKLWLRSKTAHYHFLSSRTQFYIRKNSNQVREENKVTKSKDHQLTKTTKQFIEVLKFMLSLFLYFFSKKITIHYQ